MMRVMTPRRYRGQGTPYFWGILLACACMIVTLCAWRLHAVAPPADAPWLYDEVWAVARDRLLSAVIIGAALGTAGVLLRTATSNPLADPHVTGVNSGAAFGAVAASFVGGSYNGALLLPAALIGASVAAFLVISLSLRGGSTDLSGAMSIQKMVLLGIAVSAVFSALTSIVLVLDEAQLTTVLAWLNGRLGGVRLPDIVPVIIAFTLLFPAVLAYGRVFDVLATGESMSRSVGVDPARVRKSAVIAAVMLVSACVAAAGPIGFLGLLSATFAYRLCGPRHRRAFALASVIGALALLGADSIGQALWAPAETPVGILTGIAGIPLLLWGIRQPTAQGKRG